MFKVLKNKWFWISLPILAISIFLTASDLARRFAFHSLPMGAGAAAKLACSGVYMMGREPDEVVRRDMRPFYDPLLKVASYEFDQEKQTATASMLGIFSQTALYRPGVGCTLMHDTSREDLLQQSKGISEYSRSHRPEAWPAGDIVAIEENDANIDWEQLNKAIDGAFEDNTENRIIDTRAVIVVYEGKIIAERYADGFNDQSRFLSWSASKNITSALIGTMVTDGLLELNAPAPVPEWSADDDPRRNIHLHHVLTMSTGLKFEEPYLPNSDSTNMLFHEEGMGKFAASKSLGYEPGSKWAYSSGTTNILSRILHDRAGGSLKSVHDYSWRRFFEPVGMTSAIFEPDTYGSFVGSSYFYASARDWARFGLLFLNEGRVGDQQILSKEWVKYSRTPVAPSHGMYGAQFWLNIGDPEIDRKPLMPDAPKDMYLASGYNAQWTAIVPSKKAVVVRMGWTTLGATFDANKHISGILKALPDKIEPQNIE